MHDSYTRTLDAAAARRRAAAQESRIRKMLNEVA